MLTRYLAPLNYDRFFKKVFSDVQIAKRFLEDFLGVTIDEIELLSTDYKITDDAIAVEFDYRCKIGNQYVVIDMQQWYKTDIVKRFYVYFTLNSVAQLEDIPVKSLNIGDGKQRETRNYDAINPAITLIWMVDDTLKFEEDYIAYAVLPEQSVDFIKNDILWETQNLEHLTQERNKVLSILNNNAKNLDFLAKNRLIYIFQKNIVKNKKYSPYFQWFDFAEKTKNKNNKKEDFVEFEKNKSIMLAINRLRTDKLKSEEFQYIDDFEKFRLQVEIHDEVIRKEGRQEGRQEGIEIGIQNLMLNSDFSDEKIANLMNVDVSFVKKIRQHTEEEKSKKR